MSSSFYSFTTATNIVTIRGNYSGYPTSLGELWVGSQQDLSQRLKWPWSPPHIPYFLIEKIPVFVAFLTLLSFYCSHILILTYLLLSFASSPLRSFCPSLSSGRQWKLLRQTRLSMGYAKLDPRTYRGPEGNPANYFYSLCHEVSCCLSPSICGQRESVDRPACFYLPNISIQGDEGCQVFTGTGNVSLARGVSVG